MKIEIDEKIVDSILTLNKRYWFGMFENAGIVKDEREEYKIKEAIEALSKEIESANKEKSKQPFSR